MALLTKVGSFQATTDVATTVIQVRSVGFQPKVVILFWSGRDTASDAAGEADIRGGIGFMSGASSRRCVTVSSDHAAPVGECDGVQYDDAAIATIAVGTGDPQAVEGKWDFSAWDADGFDLVVDDAFDAAFRVGYLALGGGDLKDLAIGSFTSPATPGDLDVSPGFRPDCILIVSAGASTDNTTAVDLRMMVGMAHGTGDGQAVANIFSDDGPTTSDTAGYLRGGEVVAFMTTSTSIPVRGSITQLNADGFRINFAESAARSFFYLALGGIQCRMGRFQTSTTLNATVTVQVGFEPRALMFVGTGRPQSAADTPTAHAAMSIGVATAPGSRHAQLIQDKDAIGTMDCFNAVEFDEVYINASVAATQAIEGLMDLDAILGDGFRVIMDDGDDAANDIVCLAFGDEPPPLDRRRVRLWL